MGVIESGMGVTICENGRGVIKSGRGSSKLVGWNMWKMVVVKKWWGSERKVVGGQNFGK